VPAATEKRVWKLFLALAGKIKLPRFAGKGV